MLDIVPLERRDLRKQEKRAFFQIVNTKGNRVKVTFLCSKTRQFHSKPCQHCSIFQVRKHLFRLKLCHLSTKQCGQVKSRTRSQKENVEM